ncbi:hypothetical protein [Flavobacterium salmonis]|nr:hypothetical protein [Flavobacterium salmonis]
MKNIFIKLCIVFFFSSYISAQEINKNEYSNKILGEWIQLNFDAESGDYSKSQILYNFKTNNTLEIIDNNILKGNYNYEIILTNNYQNIFVSTTNDKQLAVLKIVDKEDSDYVDVYSIKILYNDAIKLIIGMEFPGATYNHMTLEKK